MPEKDYDRNLLSKSEIVILTFFFKGAEESTGGTAVVMKFLTIKQVIIREERQTGLS